MNTITNTKAVTGEGNALREQWITDRAKRYVISQGYSSETAEAFAKFCQPYVPEMQGFGNLFDYYVDTLTP